MIRFLGIDLSADRVCIANVGRNLTARDEFTTPIPNIRHEDDGTATVNPAEWLRAGGFALAEVWADSPVAERKIWGVGFSGVPGWIALDLQLEPVCDLRLVPAPRVLDDVQRWIDAQPRAAERVAMILSPKDWFRFALSSSFATDVTEVSLCDGLDDAGRDWRREAIDPRGIPREKLPPVFESAVATARMSPDGMRSAGLPASVWLVAGASERAARLVASGDTRQRCLWAPDDGGGPLYSPGRVLDAPPPAGWVERRSPWLGLPLLERVGSGDDADAVADADDAIDAASRARAELEHAGFEVADVVRRDGSAALGAALMTGIASELVRSWDVVYRRGAALFGG